MMSQAITLTSLTVNVCAFHLLACQAVLRDIVVTQNFQIQVMLDILEAKKFPETKDCIVEVPATTERSIEDVPEDETDVDTDVSKSVNDQATSSTTRTSPTSLRTLFFLALAIFYL